MAVPPDKFAIYRQILERAWEDKNFKARLIADPKEVLEEYGISLQRGGRDPGDRRGVPA